MRLPSITKEQQQNEDCRQWHEWIYAAFMTGRPIELPVTPENFHAEQLRISGNRHHFWYVRGFRIRTKTNPEKTVMTVWLEAIPVKPPRSQQRRRRELEQDAWAQPRA